MFSRNLGDLSGTGEGAFLVTAVSFPGPVQEANESNTYDI